ncbi:hypothetical protein CONLIGDRAFT_289671 [Coniochaeta ligniaria NRRL 30616]|uniref:Uncharacterized protein n=1 Tax=Coniochaeta ligniaria NRRL 30616 TaxID=1408157 RepID=A0A1J7IU95_9PEZI|nr:hypothetical protein CONLIGDRAFT_289671 [Coniochaeta ligniaria NRRL 30616]
MPKTLPWLLILSLVLPSHQFTEYEPETCQIIGDADLYGVGIRIGFYLAYFSGLLALGFQNWAAVHDARKGVYTVNAAILVAMIRDSTLPGNLAAFEWYVLLQIAVFVPTSLSFVMNDDKPLTLALCMMVDGTYAVLQPWVYYTRLDQGWSSSCPSPKVYIFAEIDFYNPRFTAFLKAMSIISLVGGAILFFWCWSLLAATVPPVRKRHPHWAKAMIESAAESEYYIISWKNAWTIGSILFFGLTVIGFTEKTLAINNISIPGTTVASTGQLVPLLVGILTTISTVYTIATSPLPWTKEHQLRYHSGGALRESGEDPESTPDRVEPDQSKSTQDPGVSGASH